MLALRLLRPQATGAIEDAVAFLADRESVDGGWNYGNRFVYDVALPPFGQTTAVALVGLHGIHTPGPAEELVSRGVDALRRLLPVERGQLTLATSMAAFRLLDLADAEEVEIVPFLQASPDEHAPGSPILRHGGTVSSLADKLIEVKRAAGRPKDFEAIAELEALREERDRS